MGRYVLYLMLFQGAGTGVPCTVEFLLAGDNSTVAIIIRELLMLHLMLRTPSPDIGYTRRIVLKHWQGMTPASHRPKRHQIKKTKRRVYIYLCACTVLTSRYIGRRRVSTLVLWTKSREKRVENL